MHKIEHKILMWSFAASFLMWSIDAAVDAFVFRQGSFSDEMFLAVSWHELYFRSVFAACFILFGIVISRILAKRDLAEEKLKKLSTAIENSMDGVAIYNNRDEYLYVNQAYARINGYENPKEIIGRTLTLTYQQKEIDRMGRLVAPVLMKNGKWRGELIARRKNGAAYFQEASVTTLEDGGRVCIIRDITWRKRSEERLQRSERFLNTIFNSIRDPFCIIDDEFRIIRVNEAYAHLKNRPVANLIGRKCHEVLEGKETVCAGCIVGKTFRSGDPCAKEKPVVQNEGAGSWVEIYTYPILDAEGRVSHVIEYIRDITDRKKAEGEKRRLIDRLEYLSRTDSLTGLMNRRALTDSLAYEMERASRYGADLSLVLCDIDNFKEMNDTYGHDMGDRALQMMSATLKTMLRKTDFAGRYGGDEFMIILPETSLEGAENLADKIVENVRSSDITLSDGRTVRLSMSLGVAAMAGSNETIDSLVKRADEAMYNSKQGGRDRVSTMRFNF